VRRRKLFFNYDCLDLEIINKITLFYDSDKK